jgi:hypothetical protein
MSLKNLWFSSLWYLTGGSRFHQTLQETVHFPVSDPHKQLYLSSGSQPHIISVSLANRIRTWRLRESVESTFYQLDWGSRLSIDTVHLSIQQCRGRGESYKSTPFPSLIFDDIVKHHKNSIPPTRMFVPSVCITLFAVLFPMVGAMGQSSHLEALWWTDWW